MHDGPWCMGLILTLRRCPTPLVDGTDNCLTAMVDMDVLDRDLLLPFPAVPIENIEKHCKASG